MTALPEAQQVRSIACLMLGEIGDLIVTLPSADALKARYPSAQLTYVIRHSLVDLIRQHPSVDNILAYDNRTIIGKLRFLVSLRMHHWDLWVDLHTPTPNTWCSNEYVFKRNRFLMRMARTRFRAAYAMPELVTALTHAQPIPETHTIENENIVNTTLRVVNGTGENASRKRVIVPAEARAWADQFLRAAGVGPSSPIALFFGSKQPANVWPTEHIEAFLRQIAGAVPGREFLLVGGPHEQPAIRSLSQVFADHPGRFIDAVNRCSLTQTGALLSRCVAMVSTDSGPLHLADALDLPLVALFGSHGYLPIWLPQQPNKIVLNYRPPCSLCFATICPHDNLCMRALTPEAAVAALLELLRKIA